MCAAKLESRDTRKGFSKRDCATGFCNFPDKVGPTISASPQTHRASTADQSISTMSAEQAAHHLLNVLEERGLDVDLDNILLGFEDEHTKGEAAAWVHEYLNEQTLLTKEELEL